MHEDQLITIKFRDDTIFAVKRADGVFIAVRPIAETMGLSWPAQLLRIKEDPVLSKGVATIAIPSPGGVQEMTCLRLELLNGWLFKIDPRRVKEEIRARLIEYQEECYEVLFRHFQPTAAAAEPTMPTFEEPLNNREWLSMTREVRLLWGIAAARRLWAMSPLPQVQHMRAVARDAGDGGDCLAVLLDKAPAPLMPETAQLAEAQAALAAMGLRVYDKGVFVANGPAAIFAGTRWAGGAHRAALLALPGVVPDDMVRSVLGWKTRGIILPWSLIPASDLGAEV
jgi:hypothetical protein